MVVPEDEPPGSTRRIHALHERLTTYDRTFADSTAITAELMPGNWFGPASEAYREQAKNPFEAQLRAVREINAAVLDAVERHQDFRVQLATLWQDPVEREHMSRVYQSASDQLAGELLAKADELDRLAKFPEPASAGLPAPLPVAGSRRVAEPPARPPDNQPHDKDGDDPPEENGQAGSTGHNGQGGVFRPGGAVVPGVARDETERAAWLRHPPQPLEPRTDVKWQGDD